MKIIIASGNKGKIKEFKAILPDDEVLAYKEIMEEFEIVEDGNTYAKNAIIKAKAIYEKLENKKDVMVISDDSGISVPILNNEPNIYSARYAGVDATDKQNNEKLISKLKDKNIKKIPAYYTACIALIYNDKTYTVHGWMYGEVLNQEIGDGGFGYDPLFTPSGYDKTLGELDDKIKQQFSHRSKALELLGYILKVIIK